MVVEMLSESSYAQAVVMALAGIVLVAVLAFFPWAARAQDKEVPSSRAQVQLSYAPVVKRVAPAVVNVYTKRVVKEQARSPFLNDPFFQQFFGNRFSFGMPRERVQQSLGSGVIVDPSGLIVTNYHVIKDGQQFTVALSDRREFEAELVLSDERTDLAVLRIDNGKQKLPHLTFKNSDSVEVGDLVLAIGNPFGVGQTVTSGIVSALARTHVGVSDYQFFIQTDAAINPGNSGGALVTMDGRLIGINSAIYSQTGGSIGIGFAIPSNMVESVVASARDGDHVRRPWFGASLQPVDAELAQSLGLDRPGGSLIRDIYPGGPADKAGLKVGDVIRAIDGFDVEEPQAVRYRFATKGLGGKVNVGYSRDGARRETQVALIAPPEDPPADETKIAGRNPFAGATAANLSPAIADKLGLDIVGEQGVVIVNVEPGSAANQVQFQRGDIIVEVAATKIATVRDLVRITAATRPQWDFAIKRGDRVFSATVGG
ncbi:protease Do [Parvibaculum lavamentivorans DS-1]|uniref:Protease Do n=1 Tax=Parvibaculum lavamentivorans (strain DS-1 / DSM 13023 / NCIMB 13966) TaxID=402881 RepID=A7HWT7_PARL1|nr:DegQ family serine endoprotease [Parvibaculum lavamentivorans]ABS64370.1 protease Do [Parvibaculum lavamentivorans DS-1]